MPAPANEEAHRPASGHYSTDAPGAGLFSGQWVPATPGVEQVETPAAERPGVERFETAHEDLSTLSGVEKRREESHVVTVIPFPSVTFYV